MANPSPKRKWGMGGPKIAPMPSNKPGDVQCSRGHGLMGYPANCYEYEIEHPDGSTEQRVLCRICDRQDTDAAQIESDKDINKLIANWDRIQEFCGDTY